jgi:uncharacterized membrane protein
MKKRTSAVVALLAAAVTAAVAPGAGAAGASLPAAGSSPARAAASYLPSQLIGVAAVSPNDVWAVGQGANRNELIEHYDGQRWRLVKAPQPGATGVLMGVSASAADDVWAVGDYTRHNGEMHPLIEHYDGTSWSVVQAARQGMHTGLTSVSADSPDDVWAVGNQPVSEGHAPVALHWDGTGWTSVAGMDPDLDLTGVAAVSPTLAWLVGDEKKPADAPAFPRSSSAIYRWDGSTLTRVSSPDPNGDRRLASFRGGWSG